ncbi:MAG: 2-oxoacid:acceptor oxidoreductase subunit alpha [Patescibacteria group bacterium]|nr:2-oxoacid:acceptor oxidoreductase subunit alpha [Patescibacteria group bacterium]
MSLFNLKISGAAGEGIKISALIFSQACFKQGLYVHGYTEYPSLIRGGLNTFQVCADIQPILAPETKFNLEISLDDQFLSDLCHQTELPFQTRNIIALGLATYVFGLNLSILKQVIKNDFAKKSASLINQNLQAAQIGFDYGTQNYQPPPKSLLSGLTAFKDQLFLTGNDALSLGAIAGGMKFYTAYPMTPVTSILHFLAAKAKSAQLTVRHGEDEIGVINMALGASFAGVRSMVGTSGGGFSLMTEAIGLAGVTETPIVIVNGMRPGPASGMPTWTGQGDLLFAIHASQDEFPRIVLTPGDPEEAFTLTKKAQNLAEKYQLPVIILTDKYLAESYFTFKKPSAKQTNRRYSLANTQNLDPATPFKRYALSKTGVSLRTIPGQSGGVHLANSYEHDEYGYATESSIERIKQVTKRAQKINTILCSPDLVLPTLYGPNSAATTIISWGSNKGSVLTALKSLKNTNFIHFPWVWPFPKTAFLSLIKSAEKLVTLECNSTGQLNQLIAQLTGIQITNQILKFDGRPFFPDEIIQKL